MELGMVGLGRMGANISRRLMRDGHSCVAFDLDPAAVELPDCGTSGGVHGLERGFCLTVGSDVDVFEHLDPIFASLAPGVGAVRRTRGRDGDPSSAEQGGLPCGPVGSALRQDGPRWHRVWP